MFAPPAHTGKPPSRCEPCRVEHRRTAGAERTAAWRAANPDRQKKYDREYQAKRRENPAYRQRRNEFELLRKYGLSMDDFVALLDEQGGVCAICRGEPNGPGKRFHVDHCHNSLKVRGLLCGKCNTAIGLLNDDPARAESAAAYLRR